MVAMLSCHRQEVKAHESFSSIDRCRSVLNRIGQHIRHRSVRSRSRNEERRDVCTELSWLPSLVEEEKKAKLGKGSCYNCNMVVRQSAACWVVIGMKTFRRVHFVNEKSLGHDAA